LIKTTIFSAYKKDGKQFFDLVIEKGREFWPLPRVRDRNGRQSLRLRMPSPPYFAMSCQLDFLLISSIGGTGIKFFMVCPPAFI